jgi:hypothetical protein
MIATIDRVSGSRPCNRTHAADAEQASTGTADRRWPAAWPRPSGTLPVLRVPAWQAGQKAISRDSRALRSIDQRGRVTSLVGAGSICSAPPWAIDKRVLIVGISRCVSFRLTLTRMPGQVAIDKPATVAAL